MKQLDLFAEGPLDNLHVGRDSVLAFSVDHGYRLKNEIEKGAPYAALLPPYLTAVTNLTNSNKSTAVTLEDQKSETRTVDDVIKEFEAKVTWAWPIIQVVYPKGTSGYKDFFPFGKVEYDNVTQKGIGNLLAVMINACKKHKAELKDDLQTIFEQIEADYNTAKEHQGEKKEDTDAASILWNECWVVVKDLIHHHALIIADDNRRHPEKVKVYFDQSLLTPDKHTPKPAPVIEKLAIPVSSSKAAATMLVAGETLVITITGLATLYCYGATSPTQTAPESPMEFRNGMQIRIKTEVFGAPANQYLIFMNNDKNMEGSVEIERV